MIMTDYALLPCPVLCRSLPCPVSDSTGSAFYVEVLAMRIGVPAPSMTPEQHDLKISHWFSNIVSETTAERQTLNGVHA